MSLKIFSIIEHSELSSGLKEHSRKSNVKYIIGIDIIAA